MDIFLCSDEDDAIFDLGLDKDREDQLSRTFCNLICRKNVIDSEPELDQLARITGVDISLLYEMESYPDEDFMDEMEDEDLDEAETLKAKMQGNIDGVLLTVNKLIEKLSPVPDLVDLLAPVEFDTLNNQIYFSDFNKSSGDYVDNNFGQDLRNFSNYLRFLKSHNATTVWFEFG